jgi:hypothetical protein
VLTELVIAHKDGSKGAIRSLRLSKALLGAFLPERQAAIVGCSLASSNRLRVAVRVEVHSHWTTKRNGGWRADHEYPVEDVRGVWGLFGFRVGENKDLVQTFRKTTWYPFLQYVQPPNLAGGEIPEAQPRPLSPVKLDPQWICNRLLLTR